MFGACVITNLICTTGLDMLSIIKKMTINIYNIPGLMKFDNPKSVPESSFGDSRRKLFKEAEEIVRLEPCYEH